MVGDARRVGEDEGTDHLTLYQHVKRPDWGLAIAVAELDDRRTYLFDDGRLRTFMHEYVHLMSESEPPEDVAERARSYFAKHAGRAAATHKDAPPRRPPRTRTKRASTAKAAKKP
jgi:hypothetical protein